MLDVGCGTGTQLALVKKKQPSALALGLDGDIQILKIAQTKMKKGGAMEVSFQIALSFQLPYADNSFDCIFSTLMFHHLTAENKRRTANEIFRVLRPGGAFHLADFGKPHNFRMKVVSIFMRRMEQTKENLEGKLPEILHDAGFVDIQHLIDYQTIFGTLSLYFGIKPGHV